MNETTSIDQKIFACYRSEREQFNFKKNGKAVVAERILQGKLLHVYDLSVSISAIEAIPVDLRSSMKKTVKWLISNQYVPRIQNSQVIFKLNTCAISSSWGDHFNFSRTTPKPKSIILQAYKIPTASSLPLHEALKSPTVTVEHIRFLLLKGIDINTIDEQGNTALHLAANEPETSELLKIISYLLRQGAKADILNAQGKSPLHITAIKGRSESGKCLIEFYPNLLNQPSSGSEIALHLAAHYGHLSWLKIVLASVPINQIKKALKQTDDDGKQVLHHASCQANPKIVSYLLEAGAEVNAKTNYDYTPLHYAARYGFLAVARVLVQEKAKKNIKNKNKQTAQELAKQHEKHSLELFLSKSYHSILPIPPIHFSSDKLLNTYQKAIADLRTSKDILIQCEALTEIAQGYLNNQCFRLAMLTAQAAMTLIDKHPDNINLAEKRNSLCSLSQSIQISFLKACGVKDPLVFSNDFFQKRLQALRQEIEVAGKEESLDTAIILANMTQKAKAIFADILEECFCILGEPPCPYAFISLGSMSRQEMSPYSDLEFAILHPPLDQKDKEAFQNYFRVLTQLLELRVIGFGETEDKLMSYGNSIMSKGFRFDEGGNTPLGSAGLFELIQSPEQLARFQSAKSFDELLILSNSLKTVDLIMGNESLVQEYRSYVNKILDSADINLSSYMPQTKKLREQQSLYLMQGDCEEFKPRLDKQKEKSPFFDIKKELYRLPGQTIGNLALYFGITATNTWKRIEEFVEGGILSQEGGDHLKQAMRAIGRFRIKVQSHYRCEEEKAFHLGKAPQGELSNKYYQLSEEDTEALVRIYKVLLPLHAAVELFLKSQETICFSGQSFYADDLITQGQAYERLLQYDKAQSAYQAAVALNPKDIKALLRLGDVLDTRGQVNEGLRYKEQALAAAQEEHGENHELIAASLNNIGCAWETIGDANKAIEFYKKALTIWRQQYGENHQNVARSLANLGSAWGKLSDTEKALEYQEKALAIQLAIYGENNTNVAVGYNNIGDVWETTGDYKKALEFYEKALAIRLTIHGEKHPDVALVLNNVGAAWYRLGDVKKALSYYEKTLAIQYEVFGENHPLVSLSINNIGVAWEALGETEKALEFYEKSLNIRFQIYGEKHSDVADSYNNIGNAWGKLDKAKKALEYQEKALAIRLAVYGENHPDVAESFNNIGFAWFGLGNARKALEYYEKDLAISRRNYGESHPNVAVSLDNIGSAWEELGDAKKTIEFSKKALAIRLAVYGEKHPDVAMSLNNVGTIFSNFGKAKKALKYFEKALAIWCDAYGESHPDVATCLKNITIAKEKLGDHFK